MPDETQAADITANSTVTTTTTTSAPINNWGRPFFRSIFCETDGTGSTARTGSLMALSAALGWVTYCVFKTHGILPEFTSLTMFVVSIIAVLYGPAKAADVLNNINKK